jgi:hypothetical protein
MTFDPKVTKPIIEKARFALLDLHKKVIDTAKIDYEATIGTISSPNDFVRLLMGDPFFAFLHPFSQLITSLDLLLEMAWPIRELDAYAVRAEIENLLGDLPTTPTSFRDTYLPMMQKYPDVVIFHAKVKRAIQDLPKPEANKMIDYLNVRQHWSTASKLRRPTSTGNS